MKNRYRVNATILTFVALLCFGHSTGLSQQPAPPPVAIRIDPKIFDAYTGQYSDPENVGGVVLSFFRNGEKFYIRATNQDELEIFPSSGNNFFLKAFRAEAEFLRDSNGRVTGIIWRQGGNETKLKRTADVPQADTRLPYKR